MALIASIAQRVVQVADQFGSADVGGILIAELTTLHAKDEAKVLDMVRKIGEREIRCLGRF